MSTTWPIRLARVTGAGYPTAMPGAAHETMVELIRSQPQCFDALLRALGAGSLPEGARALDAAARVVDPATVQVDALLAREATGPWAVVELQRDDDAAKGRRWLLAAAALHDRRGVMGDVFVVTHARSVARWASGAATVAGPHGTELSLKPRVLCLTRKEAEALLATGRPELAFFAAWAVHAQRSDAAARVVRRAIAVTGALADAPLRDALIRGMINMVGEELRVKLREMLLMDLSKVPEGPLMRDLREEFERRGELKGKLEGELKGKLEGELKGKLEGEGQALLRVLERRGLSPDEATRARVLACADGATLDAWLDRAVTAATLAEVFSESSSLR